MNSMRVIEKPKDKAFTFNELNNFVKFPTEHTTCFSKKTVMVRIYDNEFDKRLTYGLNLSFKNKNKMKKE